MFSNWIYAVVAAAVLCAVCSVLFANGPGKKAFEFVCGLVMLAAILSPILSIDFSEYSLSLAKYRNEAEQLSADAEERKEMLDRKYIEDGYSAYILDKAKMNGVVPDEVIITTKWSNEGFWYPVGAEIILSQTEYEKDCSSIKNAIEAELGIPTDMQNWRCA